MPLIGKKTEKHETLAQQLQLTAAILRGFGISRALIRQCRVPVLDRRGLRGLKMADLFAPSLPDRVLRYSVSVCYPDSGQISGAVRRCVRGMGGAVTPSYQFHLLQLNATQVVDVAALVLLTSISTQCLSTLHGANRHPP